MCVVIYSKYFANERNEGKIIDASFVVSPRQRNTREENQTIKKGEGDSLWNDNPHKKCHKDIDARWTKKRGDTFYGYKNHAKVCRKTKLITERYEVMDYEWMILDMAEYDGRSLSSFINLILKRYLEQLEQKYPLELEKERIGG